MSIEVRHISKRFNSHVALDDISLEFPEGELVALLGPSGCGKTTLLRVIAGLEAADAGQVLFAGEDAGDRHVRERQVGFVFQHYALFRHMTVFENIAFGLRVKPRHQRIALARALAVEPRVLLLDEPFGALDAKVRRDLRRWLRRLHDEMGLTSIFVTHDQEEALEVADRIVVMNHGKVEQQGSPEAVYDHPASPFVFEFLGNVNLFHGRPGQAASDEVAYARPHEVEVHAWQDAPEGHLEARLLHARLAGPSARLELKLIGSGETLEADIAKDRYRELGLVPGAQVSVSLPTLKTYPAATRQ